MFPDIFNTLVYALRRMNDTLQNLQINKVQIQKHIDEAHNIYFSQRVLTYIIMHNALVTREEVYDLIQKCTTISMVEKTDLKEVLLNNDILNFISKQEFDTLFDKQFFNRQTKQIFKRVFNQK